MLMTMVVWLLDPMFSPIDWFTKLAYVCGYIFLTIISVGFGFGFWQNDKKDCLYLAEVRDGPDACDVAGVHRRFRFYQDDVNFFIGHRQAQYFPIKAAGPVEIVKVQLHTRKSRRRSVHAVIFALRGYPRRDSARWRGGTPVSPSNG